MTFLRALSYAHAEREDGAAALATAEQALSIDARSIGARYLRGRALGLLGRLDEAMVEIRQVLAADPENADALQAIAMLEQARVRRAKRPWWQFWNCGPRSRSVRAAAYSRSRGRGGLARRSRCVPIGLAARRPSGACV